MSLDCRLLRVVSGFQHVVKLHVVSLRLVFQIFLLISFCFSIIVMRNLGCCFLDECACGGCLGVAEAQLLFVERKSSVSSSCPSSSVSASFWSSAFVVLFVLSFRCSVGCRSRGKVRGSCRLSESATCEVICHDIPFLTVFRRSELGRSLVRSSYLLNLLSLKSMLSLSFPLFCWYYSSSGNFLLVWSCWVPVWDIYDPAVTCVFTANWTSALCIALIMWSTMVLARFLDCILVCSLRSWLLCSVVSSTGSFSESWCSTSVVLSALVAYAAAWI